LTTFATDHSVREFERATGIQLDLHAESLDLARVLRGHPEGHLLPRVDVFESTDVDAARLGGRFSVRVFHRDEPDRGVLDGGLQLNEIERGPDAGDLIAAATARRANVDVMFWPHANEIGPTEVTAWETLTAFLYQL
jgi:hypothetical protein